MTSSFLLDCSRHYEQLLERVRDCELRGDDEGLVCAIRAAAFYAWFHPPGRFCDGALENAALALGRRLEHPLASSIRRNLAETFARSNERRRRVLHVITRALETGGHTKLVMSWIARDRESQHSVLLSFQSHQPYRRDLEPTVRQHAGAFGVLPLELGNLDAIAALRETVGLGFDLVVLHSHPDDPLPTAALALEGGPPVVLVNHADHAFWLGSSVADCVACLRPEAEDLCHGRRHVRSAAQLPIPLDHRESGTARAEARRLLRLPDGPLLLSMGTAYKYVPTGSQNFLRAATRVLECEADAQLLLVGVDREELEQLGSSLHPRVRIAGVVRDPSSFQVAADVFLEPFPFGSMTAVLESVLHGSAPVLGYAPGSTLTISAGAAVEEVVDRPTDEAGWIREVRELVRDPERRAERCRILGARILDRHQGAAWRAALEALYEAAHRGGHRPRQIPVEPARCEAEDLAVSRFWEARRAFEL